MALIGIQTRIVTEIGNVLKDSMHPSIKIDPKDPKKLINTLNQAKEKIKDAVKPTGVETFTDPETGLFGFYEPGTKTKVIITSIDVPLFGNVYKDGEWKGAAGKAIRAYVMINNLASAVKAKKNFDWKGALKDFTKSVWSNFNAATGTFTSKNICNTLGKFCEEQTRLLTPTLKEHMSEMTATIESQCKNIETIWSGVNKNNTKNQKEVDENGNITQPLDKASEEVDSKNSTENTLENNTKQALNILNNRVSNVQSASSGSGGSSSGEGSSSSSSSDYIKSKMTANEKAELNRLYNEWHEADLAESKYYREHIKNCPGYPWDKNYTYIESTIKDMKNRGYITQEIYDTYISLRKDMQKKEDVYKKYNKKMYKKYNK